MPSRLLLPRRKARLQIAPLHLRLGASLINVAIGIVAALVAIGAVVGALLLPRHLGPEARAAAARSQSERRTVPLSDSPDPLVASTENPFLARLQSRKVGLPLALLSFGVAVLLEGRQSPGARLVGIRLVDVQTGRELTRRQAVIRVGTRRVWQVAMTRVFPWPTVRPPHEDEGLRLEIEAARLQHATDEKALQEALRQIYRERAINPARSACLPALTRLALGLLLDAPALWSPLKQGVPDRLARTAHVSVRRDAGGDGSVVERRRSPPAA